ncbi:hypothetical protein P3T23_005495 [Paraburkholderia sp. GAS448]
MCQECALPSMATYWHIGDTTMRFGSVTPRSVNGENSELIFFPEREGTGNRRSKACVSSGCAETHT